MRDVCRRASLAHPAPSVARADTLATCALQGWSGLLCDRPSAGAVAAAPSGSAGQGTSMWLVAAVLAVGAGGYWVYRKRRLEADRFGTYAQVPRESDL